MKGKPERASPENLLTVFMLLENLSLRFNKAIERKKEDINCAINLLKFGQVTGTNSDIGCFIDEKIIEGLRRKNVLPMTNEEVENWDAEDPLNPITTPEVAEEPDEEIPTSNNLNHSSDIPIETDLCYMDGIFINPRLRYLGDITFEEERRYIDAGLSYFGQVMFELFAAQESFKNNLYSVCVSLTQQSIEKFIKLVLLGTYRLGYYDSLNEHILPTLASRLTCPRLIEIKQLAREVENLVPNDQYYYASQAVRTRYPRKSFSLLFEPEDLPYLRYTREDALKSFSAFSKIAYLSIPALIPILLDHYPEGEFEIPSLGICIQLVGKNLCFPVDAIVSYV
jgi:HEPN domain-containing protein